jgi:hypothetical protein
MSEINQIQNSLNQFLEPNKISVFGGYETRNKKPYSLFSCIVEGIYQHWYKDFSDNEREEIARIIMKTNKNYLGDVN